MFSLPLPSQSQSLPPRLLCSPVRTAALVLPKPTEKKAQTAARLFLCSGLLFFFLQFALVRLCIFCCRRRCCVCALQLYSTAQPRRRRSLCDVFVARVTAGRRVCPVRWLRHPKLSLALSLFLLLSVSFRCLPPLAAQPRPLPTCRLPITLTHTHTPLFSPSACSHPPLPRFQSVHDYLEDYFVRGGDLSAEVLWRMARACHDRAAETKDVATKKALTEKVRRPARGLGRDAEPVQSTLQRRFYARTAQGYQMINQALEMGPNVSAVHKVGGVARRRTQRAPGRASHAPARVCNHSGRPSC